MRLFDLHCDTLGLGLDRRVSFRRTGGAVDAARGGVFAPWVQCFAAFLPDGLTAADARRHCEALLDVAARWEREEPTALRFVHPGAAAPQAVCQGVLTVENAGVLGEDPEAVAMLSRRNVRVVGVTWNGDNAWAGGCRGAGGGLTVVGRRQIGYAASLGMAVDVSHLGAAGFWQLAEWPGLPLLATHSNAAAVCPHPRNLTDDQFRALRDRGGIVGLNLYGPFLGADDRERLSHRLMRHWEHFLSLGGERCVCLGCDFDGMSVPGDWDGIRVLTRVYADLEDAGYPPAWLDGLFFDNARRFFAAH